VFANNCVQSHGGPIAAARIGNILEVLHYNIAVMQECCSGGEPICRQGSRGRQARIEYGNGLYSKLGGNTAQSKLKI